MIIEGYRWSKVLRKCVTCSNAYDQNDFTLTLDLSPYLPEHSPIQTTESFLSDYDSKSTTSTPSAAQPKFESLEETLHYFTQKDRFMQKISVKKEAQIPTQRLADLVTQLIRGEGYKHNIKITFRTYLKEIKVFSHRVDSRVARNHFLKTLACCTGLWLPMLPAHRYYHNKNTIQLYANYDMCLSPEYWLINHQIQITDAVQDYLKSSIRS
ncbi:hypothetical protein CONCODRAFT_79417 [Conidiobolus coronatus NRRL 28638]|uniref:Uncharacterized protein n=1 Tax=Conidiobolus coronatus (strain ATCC 28846 / CBS 209.66 / NRRL 28638) TaxID=796925 RepID=A0A137P2S5_CONC2|nr:hypothetical protein CONCODRAFT_79417 [Conidiobolus coronatus NRRL 28638]|eukprot:KXN69258.1 hypothetical protein CONCODRAFT_79417 [Conidiobolus coronatus NRRL 28638]